LDVGKAGTYNETMKLKGKTALVTGGNRGIGFDVCRLLATEGASVLLGSRDAQMGQEAAALLQRENLDVTLLQLDVANPESIRRATGEVGDRIDILINNAAILDRKQWKALTDEDIPRFVETNLTGPMLLTSHISDGMRKRNWGRIVNVSSGMGSISRGLGPDSVLYRVTKAALNAFTICLAQALVGSGVLVNSVDPGWVRTEMGGTSAPRTTTQGARGIVWAALLPDGGPTGGFYYNGKQADW
jgi:NAD(P)-dependent dehydrogenase (short-subunit alcohol dehydrogenase family)